MPLQDCTRVAIQRGNIESGRTSLKQDVKNAKQMEAHDPYGVRVIPTLQEVQQMFMAQEMRAQQLQYQQQCWACEFAPTYEAAKPLSEVYTNNNSNNCCTANSPNAAACAAAAAVAIPSGSLTKVYQNGRPVPTLKGAPGTPEAVREPVVADGTIVQVQFRRFAAPFLVHPTDELATVTKSDLLHKFVIVDGDRGYDLGEVIEVSDPAPSVDGQPSTAPKAAVQRFATAEEVNLFRTTMIADEQVALQCTRKLNSKLLSGRLTVEAATFQFDYRKLTIWFRSSERVFFVPLLKALNQQYKCRIWMEELK